MGGHLPNRIAMGLALALAPSLGRAGAVPLPVPRPALAAPVDVARRAADPIPSRVPLRVPLPVPRPTPRPEEDGPAVAAPRDPAPPPAPPEPDPACGGLTAGGKVVARPAAPVSGPDGCGIAAPVTLAAVVLRDGRHVALVPPALMRCDFAETFADWLRDDVVPATAGEGALLDVTDAAAYACRGRNHVSGARLSEHARGNAIDVLAFRFARRVIGLKATDAHGALTALRASACARFSTVLGPGSDAFHDTDLHLDLEHRRHGFKLCQWDVL